MLVFEWVASRKRSLQGFGVLVRFPDPVSEVWIFSVSRVPGCPLLSSSSFLALGLVASLPVLLVVGAGAFGSVRASGLTEPWGPTADILSSRMFCSFPMLGVRSLVRVDLVRGLVLRCAASASVRRRRLYPTWKMNSRGRGLFVISRFLGVLFVTEGCTVLTAFS